MIPLIIVIALFILPIIIILKRKANALLVFLSVCLGFVLATFIAADFADVITAITRGNMLATTQWIQVVLVLLPFWAAMLFTKGASTPGGALFGLLLAIVASTLAVLLVVSFLPNALQESLEDTVAWKELHNASTALLIAGGVITLFSLRKGHSSEKHEKKSKH